MELIKDVETRLDTIIKVSQIVPKCTELRFDIPIV